MDKTFRDKTKDAMLRCAKWIEDNAEEMADWVSPGCKEWSLEFRAGEDGMFPDIEVYRSCRQVAVIGYKGVDEKLFISKE